LIINLFRFRNNLISKTKQINNQILLFGINNNIIIDTWYFIIFYIRKFFFKNIKNFQIFQIIFLNKIYFFNSFFKLNFFIKKNLILKIFLNLSIKFYYFFFKLITLNYLKNYLILKKCLIEKKR
jgi:hypothetical protein